MGHLDIMEKHLIKFHIKTNTQAITWYGKQYNELIEQWLTDRRQRVVVDGEVSSWKSVYEWGNK